VSFNILRLKSEGDALMDLLAAQKIVTGEDLKNLRVVRGIISEVGNMLESA